MKLGHHIGFSVIVSAGLYVMTKSWTMSSACLISGIFIDMDHVLDYIIIYRWPFSIKRFFHVFYHELQFKQIYLVLHGWEWLTLLFTAAWITGWNPLLTGILCGSGHHMILDCINNGGNLWSYSLIWRWRNNFDFKTTFPRFIQQRNK
jgi:hypothetical protein